MEHGVSFEGFRFELQSGRLWAGDREVRLTPKASDVLKLLVTRAGAPVSKDELFATVWSGTAVSDDALTSCIQELRRSLADDSKQPRFIETRHRRGYQFIARLTESSPVAPGPPALPPDLSAIAVLPFADMSPDRDQDYLCDGLAEEIINALTHIDGLRVAARTASFQYRGAGADVRQIGRQLGVGTLLDGSVRKADNRLRVTVQLVETATGYHRWSQRFDRALTDVFAIEDEIAESIVTSLRGGFLSGREREALRRQPTGPEAYECYLRGRQYLPRLTRPDLEKSGEMFERAIELDAGYGPAYAGLAVVHATLHEWFGAQADDLAKAERASGRALELSADMPRPTWHAVRSCRSRGSTRRPRGRSRKRSG
jgi:adenylate cyclase